MTKRETRVINAFINLVNMGEFSFDYAVALLENQEKYGYISEEAKEHFYLYFEPEENIEEEVATESVVEEPVIPEN